MKNVIQPWHTHVLRNVLKNVLKQNNLLLIKVQEVEPPSINVLSINVNTSNLIND